MFYNDFEFHRDMGFWTILSPVHSVRKHRNLMLSVFFAPLSSLIVMVGELLVIKHGQPENRGINNELIRISLTANIPLAVLFLRSGGQNMKRFALLIAALLVCGIAAAHTINWRVDGNIYQTTTCDSGESITPPTAPYKYGYHFVNWELYYTPIEYLESTGTQWIDTGVYGNLETSYEIIAKSYATSESCVLFGSRESSTSKNIASLSGASSLEDFGDYQITRINFDHNNTDKNRYYNSKNYRYIEDLDDGYKIESSNHYNINFTTPITLKIAAPSNGFLEVHRNFQGKIYMCKIWDNNSLVRDFIPVLDSNNVPCMYDKVTRQFFYNQGTGQFIAGPVISE